MGRVLPVTVTPGTSPAIGTIVLGPSEVLGTGEVTGGVATATPGSAEGTFLNLVQQVAGTAPPVTAAATPPPVDTGVAVSLRLDFRDCEIDALTAGPASNSGAGLIVADLTAGAGSALVHGSRIRSQFPLGETVLLTGLGEVTVTGNVVTNEVVPLGANSGPVSFGPTPDLLRVNIPTAAALPPLDNYSIVLGPAATQLGVPAVAVTGNVFVDDTLLPARPVAFATASPTVAAILQDWNFLNTVIPFVAPPEPPPVTT